MPRGKRTTTRYWIAEIDEHALSLEEQLSLRKTQEIVENILLSLRIRVMAS